MNDQQEQRMDTTLARVRTLSDRERMMLLAYLAGHDPDVLTVALDAMEVNVLPYVREGYESPFTAGSAAEVAEGVAPVTTTAAAWDVLTGPGTMTAAMARAYINTGLHQPLGPDAQAAEVARIAGLHDDGLITSAECADWTNQVLGPDALAAERLARELGHGADR